METYINLPKTMILEEVMQEGDHCVSSFAHVRCLINEVEGANDGSAVLLTSGTEVRHRFAHYNVGKEVPPNFAEGGVCDWTEEGLRDCCALVEGPH
ncbi:hypothetical protein GBAR_LOCUS17254 [Geodia barretti]|nr:hypothetical protein GBAR_LOCUS17254 [Geodia barretti]